MLTHVIMLYLRCIKVNNRMYLPELCGRRDMSFLLSYVKSQYHVCRLFKSSSSIADKNRQHLDDYKKKKIHKKSLPEMHNHKIKNQEAKQKKQLLQSLSEKQTEQQTPLPSLPQPIPPSTIVPSSPSTPSAPTTPPIPIHIPYDIHWIFPRLLRPSGLWYIVSQITIFAVGLFSKIVLVLMNKTHVYNKQRLIDAIGKRPPGTPLVTVSNHYSCFDDPGLWGVLPMRYVCNTFKIRWSLAAHDICFTNIYHSLFFMYGKCIPIVRGSGVYQDAVDVCIQKLKLGEWVHVFPEGKVNMTKEEMRLKWGVGRIIYESPRVPIILPMWHEGMDDVLPNTEPYYLKFGKKVTLNVGKPIDMNDFIEDLKFRGVKETVARKLITDRIQDVFRKLRLETEELHRNRFL
uniref:Tafazzin family protein n=1 Tax=Glossina brevipalpis TaxID=37001 RepID=A0A1A9WQN1_9MUSC